MTDDEIFTLYYHDLTDENHKKIWMIQYQKLEEEMGKNHIIENLGLTVKVKKHNQIKNYTHLFLTINPPPSLSLDDFQKLIKNTLTTSKRLKSWIEGYLYVLEQRGETTEEAGKGFHTHILIKLLGHKKKSHIDRELKNNWKNILDVDNYHIFNIKYIDEDEALRKQSYILGTKKETIKHKKQEIDIIWRENNHLQKYYFLDYIIEQ